MKYFIFIFFFSFSFAQFVQNNCNEKILNDKELNKCRIDSIYIHDFNPRINYITTLTTKILPEYRIRRDSFGFENTLKQKIIDLKRIYDLETSKKLFIWQKDVYRN